MVADQQRRPDDADNPRDEVIIETRDAEREAEHCHVQSVVAKTACGPLSALSIVFVSRRTQRSSARAA